MYEDFKSAGGREGGFEGAVLFRASDGLSTSKENLALR